MSNNITVSKTVQQVNVSKVVQQVNVNKEVQNVSVSRPSGNITVNRSTRAINISARSPVTSVSNVDGSLTISPTTGAVIASLNLDHSNIFTQPQGIHYTGALSPVLDLTYDYQGSSGAVGINNVLEINSPLSNEPSQYAGFYTVISDNHDLTGVIEDNAVENWAFGVSVFRTGDSSVDWQDGGETISVYHAQMQNSGIFSGLSHPLTLIGFDTSIVNDIAFNNVNGNYSQEIYGNRVQIQANGSLLAGTLVRNMYGSYIQISHGGHGNAYGLYIGSIAGANNNYPIYSLATGPSYLAGNLGIGTDSQFGSGTKVLALANASVVPSTNPTGAGVLYVQGGALKYRGSSGTITTLAAA